MSLDYDSFTSGYDEGRQDIVDKLELLIDQWRKEAQHKEDIASEDFVSNTLYECIDKLNEIIKNTTKGSE